MNMRGSVLVRATAVSYADLFVDFFSGHGERGHSVVFARGSTLSDLVRRSRAKAGAFSSYRPPCPSPRSAICTK